MYHMTYDVTCKASIRRFELVARRLAGYAVAMEVARRAEEPEVNGDLRKTVSRRSLVPSRELKRKSYGRHVTQVIQ